MLHSLRLLSWILPSRRESRLPVASVHGGVLLLLLVCPGLSRAGMLEPRLLLCAVLMLLVPRRIEVLLVECLLPGMLVVSRAVLLILRIDLLSRPRRHGRRIDTALLWTRWRRLGLQDRHHSRSALRLRPEHAPTTTRCQRTKPV